MEDAILSALLDGECSGSELDDILQRLRSDPVLRAQLARMSLARDARSGVRVNPAHGDFAARVMAALPARPGPARVGPPAIAPRALPWRPAAALAAAAAFGAVAVLVLKPQPSAIEPAGAVAAVPVVQEVQPVVLDDLDRRQLQRYLISYSESRAHGMGGTLGYARYAAYADDSAASSRP